MNRTRILRLAIGVAAAALFAESLRVLGVDQVVAGVARVGWGFAIVVPLSAARDAARALAWTKAYGRGRVIYTALGHEPGVWADARFQAHLLGAIQWALGRS